MIAPEDLEPGDVVAVFSSDNSTFRGTLIVRELTGVGTSSAAISFNTQLPPGTTQGDILCLIRRRDEVRILEAREVNEASTTGPDGKLYVPVNYNKIYILEAKVSTLLSELDDERRLRQEIIRRNSRGYEERIASLESALGALRGQISGLRNLGVSGEVSQMLQLLTTYRETHRGNNDCELFDVNNDRRCSLCKNFDDLIERMRTTSPEQVTGNRRRIKSSTK